MHYNKRRVLPFLLLLLLAVSGVFLGRNNLSSMANMCSSNNTSNTSNTSASYDQAAATSTTDDIDKILAECPNTMPSTSAMDLESLQKWPLTKVQCVANGKYPFLMQYVGAVDWCCTNVGEVKVTKVMQYVFEKYQTPQSSTSSGGLMLDIGANGGFYGFLAAAMGHRILAFDLQPNCHRIIHNAIVVNRYSKQMRVVTAGVSEQETVLQVNDQECSGNFPLEALKNEAAGEKVVANVNVTLSPLRHFIPQEQVEIMLVKIDTEGNEKRVLRGALDFFKSHQIRNVIVELTPCCNFWKFNGITPQEVADVVGEIVSFGYTMIALDSNTISRTKEQAIAYVLASEGQYDVWFTLEEEVLTSISTGPTFSWAQLGKKF